MAELGAAEDVNPRDVRPPLADEVDASADESLRVEVQNRDARREALEESIGRAFNEVARGNRVALADALKRDLGVELPQSWGGRDEHWKEIPTEILDQYASRGSQMFFYGNDQSFRYYLPAYMLRGTRADARAALSALGMGGRSPEGGTRLANLLTDAQRETVRAFLEFISMYGPDHEEATRLAERWARSRSPGE